MRTDGCTGDKNTSASAAGSHVSRRRSYIDTCWYMRISASDAQSATIRRDAEKTCANTSLVCIVESPEESVMRKRRHRY